MNDEKREIKFRFYEDNKFWYFGVPYMSHEMFMKLQDPKSDNRIFEQYTGLKDKNGKEIYEGDKVTGSYHNSSVDYTKSGSVKWGDTGDSDGWSHSGTSGWVLSNGSSLLDVEEETEIIGNIHE